MRLGAREGASGGPRGSEGAEKRGIRGDVRTQGRRRAGEKRGKSRREAQGLKNLARHPSVARRAAPPGLPAPPLTCVRMESCVDHMVATGGIRRPVGQRSELARYPGGTVVLVFTRSSHIFLVNMQLYAQNMKCV